MKNRNHITFVDSIMGSGKTTWAIEYMNAHPVERYLYITPFLKECERISRDCPGLDFVMPKDKPFGKRADLHDLMKQGRNIAMTHELLKIFDLRETDKEHIEKYGYNILFGESPEKLYHSYMVFHAGEQRVGALIKGRDYYVRVDAFNECGITEGTCVKL